MRFLAGVKLPKVHSAIYCAGVVCVCLFVFSALLTLWCTSVINFFFQNCRSHHFIGMVRNSKTFMAFVKKKNVLLIVYLNNPATVCKVCFGFCFMFLFSCLLF